MRLFACVSYKGTNYQGWQKQKSAPTVQSEIEKVLSKILNTEINIYASGRTDAGVHANHQYFHFDIDKDVDIDRLMYSTNCLLPKDIKINFLKRVDDDFHARFSAKKKEYKYIVNLKGNNPFNYELNAEMYLDVDDNLLKESLDLFIGEHNFQDFTSKEEDDNNFVRTIYFASFTRSGDQLVISFIGNGFMRYQIRDMVATALMVAANKESIEFIKHHLKDKKERDIVSYKAPAEGLYLEEVYY